MDDAMTNNFDDLEQTTNLTIVSWSNLDLSFAPLAWTSSFWAWTLLLGAYAKPFSLSFSALSFCNFFCHSDKSSEHLSFVSFLDSGKSFLILGTLTLFCSDLASRMLIDDSPMPLSTIAGFFSNVIDFSLVKSRSEIFFFRPSNFTR